MLALLLLRSGCWACSCWCVSGPHANACAGAACCALAFGPAAAGACLVLEAMPLKDMRKLLYSRCNVLYYLENVESVSVSVCCVCVQQQKSKKQKKGS
jgi:hypothetical protein